MRLDLHTHSLYSDGTYTVEKLVSVAKQNNLEYIALTDHNTVAGFDDLLKSSNNYEQRVIKGCEFSTSYTREIHMLGYFPYDFDINSKQATNISYLINNYDDGKKKQLEKIINNLSKDIDVNFDEFIQFAKKLKDNENYNRTHIAAYLIYKGYAEDYSECFREFLSDKGKYYVEKENIELLDAVKLVNDAGGLVSIAHIKQYYQLSNEEVKKMLTRCAHLAKNLGIELYHYDHDENEIERIRTIANEVSKETGVNIFYTSGSDCHGDKKTNFIGDFSAFELSKEMIETRDEDLLKTLSIFKDYRIIK